MASDKHDPHDVVRLTTAANPVEAHILEQALLAEGIRCRVVGDYLGAGFGDVPGVRPEVWVHRDDLAAAEAVLEAGAHKAAEDETNEPEA
jgi:hypothetical protein